MTIEDMTNKYGEPLRYRDSGGIYVGLFYDLLFKEVYVYYKNLDKDIHFVLNPPNHLAVDTYNHPIFYAHAAMNGKDNPKRLVPAVV